MRKQLLVSLGSAAFLISSPAAAKALKWVDAPPGLPAGAKLAVISGDPSKAGPFKVQIKMPADYVVAPHHHPTDEVVRVKSGTLNYGMGETVEKGNAGTLSDPKTHITMAAGMNHWVFTTAPTVIEVSATGPFQIVYANPADDPRNAKK